MVPDRSRDDASGSFFIVGIGASAGGLEAVTTLLRRSRIEGAAFVVVHLSDITTPIASMPRSASDRKNASMGISGHAPGAGAST